MALVNITNIDLNRHEHQQICSKYVVLFHTESLNKYMFSLNTNVHMLLYGGGLVLT